MLDYLDKVNSATTYAQRYSILKNSRLKWFTRDKIASAEYAIKDRRTELLFELENLKRLENVLMVAKKSIMKAQK